jgi:hypothetical protein
MMQGAASVVDSVLVRGGDVAARISDWRASGFDCRAFRMRAASREVWLLATGRGLSS